MHYLMARRVKTGQMKMVTYHKTISNKPTSRIAAVTVCGGFNYLYIYIYMHGSSLHFKAKVYTPITGIVHNLSYGMTHMLIDC